ncbi:2-C-methyl-D-erythritol 4-phosphate cytidylyltransferase [Variovorax sp. VNK109]|uniref:2-C-methyl-D-erythritol 4-phosphate cytidylyltransferase n=1 Tax=Variovorax sp. VNK109 TaxID=3400919 RepID=UPI003C054721
MPESKPDFPSDPPSGTPADAPRLFALIPCAGTGSRAGMALAKQYTLVAGQAMVRHTVDAFRALRGELAGLWVVIAADDEAFRRILPDFGRRPGQDGAGEHLLAAGGATRAATVLNGLRALLAHETAGAQADDWVLVHDAARCLVTPAQIRALVAACRHDAVGGLLAHRLADTLKQSAAAGADARVSATLDRSDKWLAQTPQMFRIGALIEALEKAGTQVTDEAGAMEAMGLEPLLVPGSAQNFKVTYPEDFALAEAVLNSRK